MEQQLANYILQAMLAWTLVKGQQTVGPEKLRPVAEDDAHVVSGNRPLFSDDASGAKTALLLASEAHLETGGSYADWIADGRCNDSAWRVAHLDFLAKIGGDCDGGKAFTFWQIHPPGELAVSYADGRVRVLRPGNPSGKELLADRRLAVATALMMTRSSMMVGGRGDLCAYTGEAWPHCPRAQLRLDRAVRWWREHPFPQ